MTWPRKSPPNGAGKGDGWGGPAKGSAPRGAKQPPFQPGNKAAAGTHDMSDMEKAAKLRAHLYTLATTAQREETQVSATIAFLNRVEGTPKQFFEQKTEMTVKRVINGDPITADEWAAKYGDEAEPGASKPN